MVDFISALHYLDCSAYTGQRFVWIKSWCFLQFSSSNVILCQKRCRRNDLRKLVRLFVSVWFYEHTQNQSVGLRQVEQKLETDAALNLKCLSLSPEGSSPAVCSVLMLNQSVLMRAEGPLMSPANTSRDRCPAWKHLFIRLTNERTAIIIHF